MPPLAKSKQRQLLLVSLSLMVIIAGITLNKNDNKHAVYHTQLLNVTDH